MFGHLFLLLFFSSANCTTINEIDGQKVAPASNFSPFSRQHCLIDEDDDDDEIGAAVAGPPAPANVAAEKASKKKRKKKFFTESDRYGIIELFDALKKQFRATFGCCALSNRQLEAKLAKLFDVHTSTINRWKRQLCISRRINIYSDKEKLDFIKQFDKMKSKFPAKSSVDCHRKIDKKICKKLGISRGTIGRWKKEFGLSLKRNHSEKERFDIVKRYHRIKAMDPKRRNIDIAQMLNISETSLRNWRREFEERIRRAKTENGKEKI